MFFLSFFPSFLSDCCFIIIISFFLYHTILIIMETFWGTFEVFLPSLEVNQESSRWCNWCYLHPKFLLCVNISGTDNNVSVVCHFFFIKNCLICHSGKKWCSFLKIFVSSFFRCINALIIRRLIILVSNAHIFRLLVCSLERSPLSLSYTESHIINYTTVLNPHLADDLSSQDSI